jgi:hypothetical protein
MLHDALLVYVCSCHVSTSTLTETVLLTITWNLYVLSWYDKGNKSESTTISLN